VHGLLVGVVIGLLPFFDWPAASDRLIVNSWPGWKGIIFSAAGFGLAAFSLLMMIRRARIKEAKDNQTFAGRNGDIAP
jgi:hypothetical protein